ncbi:MAG: hypothetical protein ACFFB0_12505 [Promethearchaeota archaeon]
MDLLLGIIFLILRIILYIGIFFIIAYLLIPWIFKYFISPRFNASYVYNSKDFIQKSKLIECPKQNNIPQVDIDKNKGIYTISFGNKRELIKGIVKIKHKNKIYVNTEPARSERTLELLNINETNDIDKLGTFQSTDMHFRFENEEKFVDISIKQYFDGNFIVFELFIPEGLEITDKGNYSELITFFPSFLNESLNTNIFTFRNAIFCPPSRKIGVTSAPVLFYDDELNCYIISPLDGFLNTVISKSKGKRISCGIHGLIKGLPKGFSQKFILLFGKGINESMEKLGNILLKYHESKQKSLYANVVTSYLGFWTNNGAYYYYKKEKGLSYENTMLAIKNYFDDHKIPIGYYNFDSWWYLKHTNKVFTTLFRPFVRLIGGGLYGNTLRWEADPENFSTDLKTYIQERFKKPITAHNRRWDARSPYVIEFEFETYKNHAVPLKKEFWDWLMNQAKESGINVYEQDWMKNQINSMPILRNNYNAKEQWLNNMANAAKENDVDIFYCMQTPGILLYSIKHSNVNISRCSGDYNRRWPLSYRFIHSTQTNILFHAVSINSNPDVFRSKTMKGVKFRPFGEKFPYFKCLYQILNAGVVAPGDKKENINWPLLHKTCRDDGLLLKPDKCLTTNDLMFKKHRKYYICDTYSKINKLTWRYILVCNIWPKRVKERFFTLKELGYDYRECLFYDYISGELIRIQKDDKIKVGYLKKYSYKYYILCPITISGMALIGCPDKFVTCAKKLFQEVNATTDSLSFSIENIKDAEITILVYAENKPTSIKINNNLINSWKYTKLQKLIKFGVKFDISGKKNIKIQI